MVRRRRLGGWSEPPRVEEGVARVGNGPIVYEPTPAACHVELPEGPEDTSYVRRRVPSAPDAGVDREDVDDDLDESPISLTGLGLHAPLQGSLPPIDTASLGQPTHYTHPPGGDPRFDPNARPRDGGYSLVTQRPRRSKRRK